MITTVGAAETIQLVSSSGPSWPVMIAAGAAGSALTLLTRVVSTPSDVAAHDRRIADIDKDLDRYAADEYVRLAFNLRELRFPGGHDSETPEREISRQCALAVVASTHL